MFRRTRRVMPEHETELTLVEPAESRDAEVAEVAGNDTVADAGGTAAPTAGDATVSRAEYDQLKTERDQLLDRLARLQAEFENARKRAERERTEFRDYATGSVVEQFLPVVDNFELALKSDGSAAQLRHGVELIVKQMEEILRQMRHLAAWIATICLTSTLPRRFAAVTGCGSGFCGRRWCA